LKGIEEMYEDFAPKLAKVLTEYCVPIHKGQWAFINASANAELLIDALQVAIMERGGHVNVNSGTVNGSEIFYKYATDEHLKFESPIIRTVYEKADVFYSIRSAINTKRFSRVDPERMAIGQLTYKPLSEVFNARAAAGDLRWNITTWPSHAAAQDAEMSLMDYTEFVYKACALDRDDPVAYWHEFRDRQARFVDWLADKKHCEVRGPGIELSFDFEGRNWVNCHGIKNFPDGEIFTSPIEDSVNGRVEFNMPSVYGGRELNGIKLTFEDGKVIEASADKGQDYLYAQLDTDEGARYLGEFAIGTNMGIQEFTREILFDEKMGGTIHMALGLGLSDAGGVNKSVVHWDMVHRMTDGGEVTIDGDLFYKSGEFMLEKEGALS
jgi:aminopeptidase